MSPSPTHYKSTSPLEQYRYIDMRMVFCGVVHVHPHVHVWLCKHAVYTLQEFLLSAEVCVPRVSVCVPELELGHCLLDHSLSSTLTLCNTTHSALPWTIHPSHGTLYIPLSMYCVCACYYTHVCTTYRSARCYKGESLLRSPTATYQHRYT